MANISFILLLDQPLGYRRLLQELKNALSDDRFNHFRLIVAYAKSGPLYRLHEYMETWAAAGKTAEANIGIDQQGTSKEALEIALSFFNKVYVTRERGITFHPKIYFFAVINTWWWLAFSLLSDFHRLPLHQLVPGAPQAVACFK